MRQWSPADNCHTHALQQSIPQPFLGDPWPFKICYLFPLFYICFLFTLQETMELEEVQGGVTLSDVQRLPFEVDPGRAGRLHTFMQQQGWIGGGGGGAEEDPMQQQQQQQQQQQGGGKLVRERSQPMSPRQRPKAG
jgi:hypothetical protein